MVLNKGDDLFLVEVIIFKYTKITLILKNAKRISCCILKSPKIKCRGKGKKVLLFRKKKKSILLLISVIVPVNAICIYLNCKIKPVLL